MRISHFTDRKHPPSADEIRLVLGTKYKLWERVIRLVEADDRVSGEWTTWGGGWNIRYRSRGSSLVALYPQQGGFVAQVVLGKAQSEQALALHLGDKVGKMLRERPQLRDGKWLYIPVRTTADVEDVEQLIELKRA
ncbi:MAG TPA: DUF3788 family protein [Anaerolineae bacterium]|nr:DUF3788 family protein [Anaerolineae bacterium]